MFWKKNEGRIITLLDIKTYYKATETKTAYEQTPNVETMEKNWESRNKLKCQLILDKAVKNVHWIQSLFHKWWGNCSSAHWGSILDLCTSALTQSMWEILNLRVRSQLWQHIKKHRGQASVHCNVQVIFR